MKNKNFKVRVLDQILTNKLFKIGEKYYIDIDGHQVNYNLEFRIYLVVETFNPELNPTFSDKWNIFNFDHEYINIENLIFTLLSPSPEQSEE